MVFHRHICAFILSELSIWYHNCIPGGETFKNLYRIAHHRLLLHKLQYMLHGDDIRCITDLHTSRNHDPAHGPNPQPQDNVLCLTGYCVLWYKSGMDRVEITTPVYHREYHPCWNTGRCEIRVICLGFKRVIGYWGEFRREEQMVDCAFI